MPLDLWAVSQKIGEECPPAGAHGGGAMHGEFLQLPQDGEAMFGDLRRQIGQRLHSEGLHDATGIAQIICKDAIHNLAFARIPPKTRQHLSDVPAHFFLVAASKFTGEFGFVGTQVFRMDHRNLFEGVSCPSPHDRIIDGKAGKQRAKQLWTGEHLSDDLVGPTDRPAITAFELAQD